MNTYKIINKFFAAHQLKTNGLYRMQQGPNVQQKCIDFINQLAITGVSWSN